MGIITTTNVSMNTIQQQWNGTSGNTVSMNDTNFRYLAGKPQSASASSISFNDIKGAAYIVTSSGGTSVDVRATAVNAGWGGTAPVWFRVNGNTYSGSTGTASLVISGSFPGGLIIDILSGVTLAGRGGNGGNGSTINVYGLAGGTGGSAISISSYTGGTLYIRNNGTINAGSGGGGGGGGGYYAVGYSQTNYLGGGGGGGAAGGSGGTGGNAGGAAGVTTGGSGGAGGGGTTRVATAGGAGGGVASAGTAGTTSYYYYYSGYTLVGPVVLVGGGAGGARGSAVTGSVGVVTWITQGTVNGTIS